VLSDTETPKPADQPVYNFQFIKALVEQLDEGERGWRNLYVELGLTPHEVVYEDLVDPSSYEAQVRAILDHLGVEASLPVPALRTSRQGDALNNEWSARFVAERTAGKSSPSGEQ
jgi:LPS sulfotransferase NodH